MRLVMAGSLSLIKGTDYEYSYTIYDAGGDVPEYKLRAIAGFNGDKFVITMYWELKSEPVPERCYHK